MSNAPGGLPYLRSSTLQIPALDAPGIFDTKALLNEADGPMLLDEIAFQVGVTTSNVQMDDTSYASQWQARIEYGRYPLTNGFVPMMCMGPPYNPEAEFTGRSTLYTENPYYLRYGYFSWRFPKPLFLPRGHGLNASVLCATDGRRPAALLTEATVTMVMKGRILPMGTRPPLHQDVPYVTGFAPTYSGTPGAGGKWDRLRSNELELKNPFLVPLHVQRLIARAETGGSTGAPYADVAVPVSGSPNKPVWTLVALTDLHGQPISRDPIAHNSLAGTYALSWTLGVDLPPREGFIVNVLEEPGLYPNTDPVRLMYHIVGSRKEELLGGCP